MQDVQERLTRYLNDAWSVEKSLRTVFADFRKEISNTELDTLFGALENEAYRHEETLEAHIRARGQEPNGGKGWLNQLFAKTLDILHAAHDAYEKSVTDLMKAYTIVRFQTAIYESIRSYAEALGETDTAKMATMHRDDAEAQAKRLWPYLGNVAGHIPVPEPALV
jgi:ferritin-like metal-binding protein YciE